MGKRVIIVGGGIAGCAAALAARKTGCEVELFERTDMLLGAGLAGGIMRNNGRFTAAEEMIAMGGGDLFRLTDAHARHTNVDFPGHRHVTLYELMAIEPAVRAALQDAGIKVHFTARARDVELTNGAVTKVTADVLQGDPVEAFGDAFVDSTGTFGPQGNCAKYGAGCVMCVFRCPTFGARVSITAKAGIQEIMGERADGNFGAMSGSCELPKDSLAPEIQSELNTTGVCVVAIPPHLQANSAAMGQKTCQQYARKEYAENLILLDTGHAKLMSSYYPLELLRQIPGFEKARFEDPYSGGIGNSIRYLGMSPRDNALRVEGLTNVFCGGEKAGLLVGLTEAIVTGTLAGHNAARTALGLEPLILPQSLACGDAIAYVREAMQTKEGRAQKFTFSGSVFFERMRERGTYTTDAETIATRVAQAGMTNIFARRLSAE